MREAELRHVADIGTHRPQTINGVLGTPDILEDLLLLFPPGGNVAAVDAVVEML